MTRRESVRVRGVSVTGETDLSESDFAGISADCSGIIFASTGIASVFTGISFDCSGILSDCAGIHSGFAGISSDCSGIQSAFTGINPDGI